ESTSALALRYLPRDRFLSWRQRYHAARIKLYPLMRALYGTFDAAALRHHLENRLERDFEILMVHSSLNHMLPMYSDTPLNLVRMLIGFCGPDRTLVMPAFSFNEGGDAHIGAAPSRHAPFDLRQTPSRMGLATELFRRTKGVLQSRHPIYRVSAL